MCDSADSCDVWDVTHPVARKAHKCLACDETIEPGHMYHRTAMLFDGQWDHMLHCTRCHRIFIAIQGKNHAEGNGVVAIDPELDCGESWVDLFGEPPIEIQALAFMLPGESIPARADSSPSLAITPNGNI